MCLWRSGISQVSLARFHCKDTRTVIIFSNTHNPFFSPSYIHSTTMQHTPSHLPSPQHVQIPIQQHPPHILSKLPFLFPHSTSDSSSRITKSLSILYHGKAFQQQRSQTPSIKKQRESASQAPSRQVCILFHFPSISYSIQMESKLIALVDRVLLPPLPLRATRYAQVYPFVCCD